MNGTILDTLVRSLKNGAALVASELEPDGDWSPVVIFGRRDGAAALIEAPELSTDLRHVYMRDVVAPVVRVEKAVAVVFIQTIWALHEVSEEQARRIKVGEEPSARNHPDREEGLGLVGIDVAGTEVMSFAKIVRRDGEHPLLEDWQDSPSEGYVTGDMFEPLRWAVRAPHVEVPQL